ncbi:MAG: hypothetical protein KDD22_02450 [Bdellovibrionales bacterium]|nr:hypothetical protein [Bdellovibrionales bacterium]
MMKINLLTPDQRKELEKKKAREQKKKAKADGTVFSGLNRLEMAATGLVGFALLVYILIPG